MQHLGIKIAFFLDGLIFINYGMQVQLLALECLYLKSSHEVVKAHYLKDNFQSLCLSHPLSKLLTNFSSSLLHFDVHMICSRWAVNLVTQLMLLDLLFKKVFWLCLPTDHSSKVTTSLISGSSFMSRYLKIFNCFIINFTLHFFK